VAKAGTEPIHHHPRSHSKSSATRSLKRKMDSNAGRVRRIARPQNQSHPSYGHPASIHDFRRHHAAIALKRQSELTVESFEIYDKELEKLRDDVVGPTDCEWQGWTVEKSIDRYECSTLKTAAPCWHDCPYVPGTMKGASRPRGDDMPIAKPRPTSAACKTRIVDLVATSGTFQGRIMNAESKEG